MKAILGLMVAAVFTAGVTASSAQQKIETIRLTVGSSHPPVIPWVLAMRNTVVANTNKELERRGSKYRVEWNEAYGGVLFNFENTLEAVEQGITDFAWVGTLWEPAKMPVHNIGFALPFVTDNMDTIIKVMDELSVKNPAFAREWTRHNAVFFATTTSDSYQLFTKFPVTKLEDLKGKKILGAGAVGSWIEGLGGVFVNSGIPQMYNAVQTGLGEGVMLIPSGAVPIKLYEVAPYVTYVNIGSVPFGAFAANKQKWDSLPQEVRDVILPIARQYSAENVRIVKEREKEGVETMQKHGAKLSTLPADERTRWAKSMPDLARRWIADQERRGVPEAKDLVKQYMDAMRKGGAKPARDWDAGL